jgi:hypothetical protein
MEKHIGRRGKTVVDTKALLELLNHYEQMETSDRVRALMTPEGKVSTSHILYEAVKAVYTDEHMEADGVWLVIMDALMPMIKKRQEQLHIQRVFK